jgi:scyllo-inositol 2-dehydrogenase (NAD+)
MINPAILNKNALRVATIGCGRMGASVRPQVERWAPAHLRDTTHLSAVRALGIAKSLAAADLSQELLYMARESFALDACYTDYVRMLKDFEPELLTIATRTPLKARILEEAICQGIRAIHVEKPLCNTEAERRHLADLFASPNLFVSSGCLRRYAGPYLAARDWFAADAEGAAQDISISLGCAPLAWTQFHAVDLALFFAGDRKVAYVQANLHDVVREGDTVINDPVVQSIVIGFDDGLVARIGQGCGANVCLSKAQGQYDLFSDGHQLLRGAKAEPEDPYLRKTMTPVGSGVLSGTQAPIAQIAGALQGDSGCRVETQRNMEDFLVAQHVCFAALVSDANDGRRTPLDNVPESFCFLGKTGELYA